MEQCNDDRLTALSLLLDVRSGLSAKLAPVFAAHDISEHDFDAVLHLARSQSGVLRMTDLARQTGISTSGMTRIVDRLERQGLVAREPHPTDRRVLVVRLTLEGETRAVALLPELLEAIDQWFTGRLSPEQLKQVLASLHIVRCAVLPECDTAL